MKTIITKVENNRVAKFLPIEDKLAEQKLAELLPSYPDAFIYNGDYLPTLWVENGVTSIVPIFEPDTIPTIISMRQARLALYNAGLLSLVDESLSLMPIEEQRVRAQIEWEYATVVDRNSALVFGLSGALGLTDVMLDNLFIEASKL